MINVILSDSVTVWLGLLRFGSLVIIVLDTSVIAEAGLTVIRWEDLNIVHNISVVGSVQSLIRIGITVIDEQFTVAGTVIVVMVTLVIVLWLS